MEGLSGAVSFEEFEVKNRTLYHYGYISWLGRFGRWMELTFILAAAH